MTAVLSTLAPIQINSTVLATRNVSITYAVTNEPSVHSGQLFPTLQLVPGADPEVTFETPFKEAYDLIGFTALQATTLDVWFAKFATTGVKSTSTDHSKMSLNTSCKALCMIDSVSVAQDGLLVATVRCVIQANDGMTAPMVAGTGTLITLAAQPTLHTNGPVNLTGTTTDGVSDWTIDMGQRVQLDRTDGDLYPTVVSYTGGSPQINVNFQDVATLMAALDIIGEDASTTTVCFARPFSATTGIVGTSATAVSVTLAAGLVIPETAEAGVDGRATYALRCTPAASSGDTHPLTVATNATAP